MKSKKVLWFRANPTAEDKTTAKNSGLIIRDPRMCHGTDFVEQCDAVCGDVPESYGHIETVDLPVCGDVPESDAPTRDEMKAYLNEKGVDFPANIKGDKLAELYESAKAE